MSEELRRDLQALIRLVRPHVLAEAVLLYGLGGAIAHYLGHQFSAFLYLAGQTLVLAIIVSALALDAFFSEGGAGLQTSPRARLHVEGTPSRMPLRWALYGGIVGLTLAATLTSVLVARTAIGPVSALLLVAGALLALSYAALPFHLARSGYGEVISTFLLAAGLPTFSYTLITGDLHRLLLMSTAPLVSVTFGTQLALQLPGYGRNLGASPSNLMERLGWEAGMRIHDIVLLLGYLLLAIAWLLGLPNRVAFGSLLSLPLALAQIWYLGRIRQGTPPRWWLLRASSYGLVGMLTYLELSGYLLT